MLQLLNTRHTAGCAPSNRHRRIPSQEISIKKSKGPHPSLNSSMPDPTNTDKLLKGRMRPSTDKNKIFITRPTNHEQTLLHPQKTAPSTIPSIQPLWTLTTRLLYFAACSVPLRIDKHIRLRFLLKARSDRRRSATGKHWVSLTCYQHLVEVQRRHLRNVWPR